MTWRHEAACKPSPDGFSVGFLFDAAIADETDNDRQARHATARAFCTVCPVAQQCLDDALADPHRDGIHAGYLLETENTE